jgi:hypothetical protein
VLARELKLTPGPLEDLLASAGQVGTQAYSRPPPRDLLVSVLAKDLKLTPWPRDVLCLGTT